MSDTTQTALLFLYTETSLHAGTGSTISAIDLPIQRDRVTNYPIVQGSGIKGSLRSQCPPDQTEAVAAIFGPDTESAGKYAGAVACSEARILLFPVRSMEGVFAYITSNHAIARLVREATQAGIMTDDEAKTFGTLTTTSQALNTKKYSAVAVDNNVVLEEYTFQAQPTPAVDTLADWLSKYAFPKTTAYGFWNHKIKNSLVVLPENDFRDFVVNSTEITTHIRLQPDSKTVEGGALWTSESLPSDTLLFTTVTTHNLRTEEKAPVPDKLKGRSAKDVLEWITAYVGEGRGRIQLGGDETTGLGIVATTWAK